MLPNKFWPVTDFIRQPGLENPGLIRFREASFGSQKPALVRQDSPKF
jgi:hypothetical protein